MNCKPNQPAMIVRNTSDNGCVEREIGRPVMTGSQISWLYLSHRGLQLIEGWTIKGKLSCSHCGQPFWVPDADLQPLRGKQDEQTPPPAESPLPKPMTEPVL